MQNKFFFELKTMIIRRLQVIVQTAFRQNNAFLWREMKNTYCTVAQLGQTGPSFTQECGQSSWHMKLQRIVVACSLISDRDTHTWTGDDGLLLP